jgi:geranylgeranyl reductase family protein
MSIADVLMIGAGPAGAITAYFLAKAGVNVQILEKARFPRQKTCGGGLTHRAFREIPFEIDPLIHQTVTWGYVGVNGSHYQTIHGNYPISYLIDRPSFDAFLLQKAIDQGAKCNFGERCRSVTQMGDRVQVESDGRTYQGRYLVGADGVHSRVASELGLLPNRPTSLAHEARIAFSPQNTNGFTDAITFDFGALASGYAWIFPKRDHLNVGVFRSWPGKRTDKNQLESFIKKHPGLSQADVQDRRAYPIPLGIRYKRLHKGNALLVRDAANLADPWLGEGLYYAISSGKLAAEEILDHLRTESPDLSGYTQKIHQRFSRQFACARRLSLIVNALPSLSVRLLQSSTSLQGMIIDLLKGDQNHETIWREIQTWPFKRFIAAIRRILPK